MVNPVAVRTDSNSEFELREQNSFVSDEYKQKYKLGCTLSRPWTKGTAMVIRDFKNGTVGEKVVAVLLSFALIISSPASLVGLGMRQFYSRYRNDFACKLAAKTVPSDAPNKIKVMTWNVALGSRVLAAVNGLLFPEKRYNLIADKIIEESPDVVNLQEVFDYTIRRKLAKKLSAAGYHCFHSFNPKGIGQDSGLFTAVKNTEETKVNKVASWQFKNCIGHDYFCNKGIVRLRIQRGEKEFNLYNTHLQASYNGPQYGAVRHQQTQFLGLEIQNGMIINPILAGDLNFGKIPQEGDSQEEYNTNMTNLYRAGFRDCYNGPKATFVSEDHLSNSKLDYILSTNLVNNHDVIETGRDFSDHRPVIVPIMI